MFMKIRCFIITLMCASIFCMKGNAQEVQPSAEFRDTANLEDIDELPFFDTAVGFDKATNVTIYQSFDPTKEIFYLLPSEIEVSNPTFRYTVKNNTYKGRLDADLTLKEHRKNSGYDAASLEISNRFANAEFRVIQPKEARFYFTAWGERSLVNVEGASVRPFTPVPISIALGEPISRVLLRQLSSAANIFSVTMNYTAIGVVLNTDGTPKVGERTFTLGRTIGFSCGSSPERVVNTITGETGCTLLDSLTGEKVRRIQELLRVMGYYPIAVDGIVGKFTKSGIEKFQLDEGVEPLGIADSNLLKLLTKVYCDEKLSLPEVDPEIVKVGTLCDA